MKDSIDYVSEKLFVQTVPKENTIQDAVAIINAVGDQWKFLLILVAIVFWIIYRKRIGNLLDRTQKIEVIGQKVEFNESISTSDTGTQQIKQISSVVEENDQLSSELITQPKENIPNGQNSETEEASMFLVWLNLKDSKPDEAGKIFVRVQELVDSEIERQKNQIDFYYFRFYYGHSNALSDFVSYFDKIEIKEVCNHYHYKLGLAYYIADDFSNAILNLEKVPDGSIVIKADYLWKSYYNAGEKEKAKTYLFEQTQNTDIKYRAAMFSFLGDFFEREKNSLFRALAFEMAIDSEPNNTDYLFKAAYSYYENDFHLISISHYFKCIFYNADGSSALNNLGVSLNSINLNYNAIKYYRKSFDLGNSLAGSNLAYKLMYQGFGIEAEEIIKKSSGLENPHMNIWKAKDELESALQKEEDKLKELKSQSIQHREFIKTFASAAMAEKKLEINLGINWVINDGIVVEITIPIEYVNINWMIGDVKHTITFPKAKAAGISEYKTVPGTYRYDEYKTFKGFYNAENDVINFLFYKDSDSLALRLVAQSKATGIDNPEGEQTKMLTSS